MYISLAINAVTEEDVRRLMTRVPKILPSHGTIHFDVSAVSNISPEFLNLKSYLLNHRFEVHFMVPDWEYRLVPWLEAGVKRVIVQVEDLGGSAANLIEVASRYGAEAMLSIALETPLEALAPYYGRFHAFQIMGVPLGKSGQPFDPRALERIRAVRTACPDAILQLDGGVTLETARLAKAVGADSVASSSYIWNSADPKAAYEELRLI